MDAAGKIALRVLLLVNGFTLMYCQQATTTGPTSRSVKVPPLIAVEPPQEMAFRVGESIEMPCVATGEPEPTYDWLMNEQDFDPSGLDGRIAIQPGVGTLIFANPLKRDEALYQCNGTNDVGTAMTVKINLRQAYLDPFVQAPIRKHTPQLGDSVTLDCIPPRSYPKPDIFWAVIQPGSGFAPVDLTDRVTIDPEGNLHFTNIISDDYQNGNRYACIVQNEVMRSIQQGAYATITPQGQTVENHAPAILWADDNVQVSLRGETWRVKCIFSGSPTPRVDWARQGGGLPPNHKIESFGQEFVIENVQYDNADKYECQGINDEATTPIRRSFQLSVESKPMWINKPESVDTAEGETAVIHCLAESQPDPDYFWFLDGVPISKVPGDPNRIVEKNKITFQNVSKDHIQVVQCNATNKHGYIYTNAYLNVLTEPPTIVDPPLIGQRAAEEQTIVLTCRVFGSPKPLVTWLKGTEQLTGGRYKVLEDGHLEITDVSLVDSGSYTCTATNIYNTASATGSLVVRRKTQIQTAPLDVMVYEGTEAKFTCTGTTDPEEVRNLEINWKKDGQLIDYQLAQRVFKNDMDNSLTISGTLSLDTGKYTCVASNGLDEDEASAQLIVQGPPDPPNNVEVECVDTANQAEIEWQPGKENYAPILNYIIQFNTTFTPDTWIDIESNVSQNTRRMLVTLSPWGNYTFRVLARNKIGVSYPSEHTKTVCRTEPGLPNKNPENVIAEGDLPTNLVVFWTPMPKIEQNGDGFKYVITYKRLRREDEGEDVVYPEESFTVDMPEAWHQVFDLDNVPAYTPYEVTVKANNANGDSTVTPERVMGFSGEDVPQYAPTDVVVDQDSVTDTEADLTFSAIDESPEAIRGFFRGYRVQFAREEDGWGNNIREQDEIINEPPYYPRPRIKRQSQVVIRLRHLPPNSNVVVQVRILNKYYAGPPSAQITFQTMEGKPGPPALFDVTSRGPTHLDLSWEPPYEANGVLIGYNISYQSITGLNLGRLQYRTPIHDPDASKVRLTGLSPDTYYRVYLSAATAQGGGEHIFLDMKTTPSEPPSPPTFDVHGITDDFVNITWEPSRSDNPGSVFYVQYRPRGMHHWLRSPDEYMDHFMEIFNLDAGTVYQVRVVAINGDDMESPAPWQEFRTDGVAPGRYDLKVSGWFYGIWLSFLLIIVLLVLFLVFKKTTDKWWQQKEDDIADQVKQLQAEEAVRQLGLFNAYAETGSRDLDPNAYADQYHPDDGGYSDEEYDDEAGAEADYDATYDKAHEAQVGYRPAEPYSPGAGYPQHMGYQPPPQDFSQQPPSYNGRGATPEPPANQSFQLQDPNRSRSSAADTFV